MSVNILYRVIFLQGRQGIIKVNEFMMTTLLTVCLYLGRRKPSLNTRDDDIFA